MIICLNFLNTYGNGIHSQIKTLVKCDSCGEERIIFKFNALKGNGVQYCKFCTTKGSNHYDYGKHRSKAIKIKLRKANLGKKLSEETKKKLSLANKGENNPMFGKRGELSPNWNPNLNNEERKKSQENRQNLSDFVKWSKTIKQIYNFICQICEDDKGGNLVSHHLYNWKDYPQKRYDLGNGICVCKNCHNLFHIIFRRRHNTPEQFEEFKLYIKEILNIKV